MYHQYKYLGDNFRNRSSSKWLVLTVYWELKDNLGEGRNGGGRESKVSEISINKYTILAYGSLNNAPCFFFVFF